MNPSLRHFIFTLPAKLREEDKQQHMIWSCWLTVLALPAMTAWSAFLLIMLVGVGKEIWDARYGSGFCVFDLMANCVGSLMALAAGWLVSGIQRLT